MKNIPVSVLELAVVSEGNNAATAIRNTVEVARHAESLGYKRIWLAEHHNMEHIASSATAVLIGHIAGLTAGKIRVGSGGIMLPNHSTLAVAEQFGTLASIYPDKIDLGLGRAPGTDQLTALALRRNNSQLDYDFQGEILQLQQYLSTNNKGSKVRAFPGEGVEVPLWILGSSTDSAYLAAALGLPYAFAAHFAPRLFKTAIEIYRKNFRPSAQLDKPYVMACVNVLAADTDEEAEFLSTSLYRMFLGIITNERKPLQAPAPLPDVFNNPEVQHALQSMMYYTFTGSKQTLQRELSAFVDGTSINELMITSHIYDMEAKLKSFSIVSAVMKNQIFNPI
ncbi:MAG TPA: LLM class flavin-dependent oxidoreductase [Haliscomenobacter sp.]|nr:LLM class flavin-dependent oxidoreductase [Haliscomenobacter sp.]